MEEWKDILESIKGDVYLRRMVTAFVVGACTIGGIMAVTGIIIAVQVTKLCWLLQYVSRY